MAADKQIELSSRLQIKFNADGLAPVIVQDAEDGQVLMVAWMNAAALEQTRAGGKATFWSRSRRKLWCKGEESGHTLNVKELRVDCDQDVILLKCTLAAGSGACHVGYRSCFYRKIGDDGNLAFVAEPVFDPKTVYKKSTHGI